jgi:hypothetical protein
MIPIADARQRAIDRVISALQSRLANELVPLTLPAGLPLPVPDNTGYYGIGQDPDDTITNRQQAIFVYDSSPREIFETFSGGPQTYGGLTRFSLNVLMMFKIAMHEPLIWNGKEMTREDVLRLRAERYTGGIINAVYKYACRAPEIHDIALLDDQATVQQPDDKRLIGLAVTRWQITQKVQIPQRSFETFGTLQANLQGDLG